MASVTALPARRLAPVETPTDTLTGNEAMRMLNSLLRDVLPRVRPDDLYYDALSALMRSTRSA